jgi:hypothetical protein
MADKANTTAPTIVANAANVLELRHHLPTPAKAGAHDSHRSRPSPGRQ